MSSSQSTFAKPEVATTTTLYIPNLVRAELCLALFNNNIVEDEVRLIFNSRVSLMEMNQVLGGKRNRFNGDGLFTVTSVGSNDRAMQVRVNLQENKQIGVIKELERFFPVPAAGEEKDEDITPVCIFSNFKNKIPCVVGAELLIDSYSGLPQTNQVKLCFDTKENMRTFVNELKKIEKFAGGVVFDRCMSESDVVIRLRLELSNKKISLFNFMEAYFINMENEAYEAKNAQRFTTNMNAPQKTETYIIDAGEDSDLGSDSELEKGTSALTLSTPK